MSGIPLYFLSTLAYFWLPVAIMAWRIYPRQDRLGRKAFWLALAVVLPMTMVMELVYLKLQIWSFSEAMDPLLGLRIHGIPVEEFSFWFGAPPFILLAYMSFDRVLGREKHS